MATITLTPGTTYQTHVGWQAVAEIGQRAFPTEVVEYRNEVARIAVEELGINQIMIACGTEQENSNTNDDADPNNIVWGNFDFVSQPSIGSSLAMALDNVVVPIRNRLLLNNQSLYLSTKVNGNNVPAHILGDEEEYAEFLEAAFIWMDNNYGFVPDHLQIVNEPSTGDGWSETHIGNCIVAVQSRLSGIGFNPTISAPELTGVANSLSWFNTMIANVPGCLQYIERISYHCYSTHNQTDLTNLGNAVVSNGMDGSVQGEKIGHDVDQLLLDLLYARAVSWEQFALAFPIANDNGAQYFLLDDTTPSSSNITWGARTKRLRQFMKYIRPGHIRYSASSSDGNFVPIAYKNQAGDYHVIVTKCNAAGDVDIATLPAGTYGITYALGSNDQVRLSNQRVNGSQTLSVTGMSNGAIVTVYGPKTLMPKRA